MTFLDYKEEIKEDIKAWLDENEYWNNSFDQLYDEAFVEDCITGNASGSYTFSSYKARENITDVLFTDELKDIYKEYGYDRIPLEDGEESIDVTIRCSLLGECLQEVLDNHEEEEEEEEEEGRK